MINLHTALAKDIASKVKAEDKATHPAPSELEQIHAKRTSLCSDGEGSPLGSSYPIRCNAEIAPTLTMASSKRLGCNLGSEGAEINTKH